MYMVMYTLVFLLRPVVAFFSSCRSQEASRKECFCSNLECPLISALRAGEHCPQMTENTLLVLFFTILLLFEKSSMSLANKVLMELTMSAGTAAVSV